LAFLIRGSYFGEEDIFKKEKRTFSAKVTSSSAEIYYLEKHVY
jgi:CRP-like cAMP-binding protein